MTHSIDLHQSHATSIAYQDLTAASQAYREQSKSAGTLRCYSQTMRKFLAWCSLHGKTPLPAAPETVSAWIAELALTGSKIATLDRHLVALKLHHVAHGYESPTTDFALRQTLGGIRRTNGIGQRRMRPLLADDIRTLLTTLPATPTGHRDRAMIALGYCGAFRRSELSALRVDFIKIERGNLEIYLPRSKTDQEGQGDTIYIERGASNDTCAVAIVERHIHASGLTDGPLLRGINRHGHVLPTGITGASMQRIMKGHISTILGLDPELYGMHSLRAGFATQLDQSGVSLTEIMEAGRWQSDVVRRYIRPDKSKYKHAHALGL